MPLWFRSPQANRRKKDDDSGDVSEEQSPFLSSSSATRRSSTKARAPTSLLPILSHPSSGNSAGLSTMPTPTCHSFLLGGQYYPGKDKRWKRRKGSRGALQMGFIACMLISCLSITWIIIESLLQSLYFPRHVPVTCNYEWLSWSTPEAAEAALDRWYHEEWPSIQRKRKAIPEDRRHKNLEQIGHSWYHRNDPPRTLVPRHKKTSFKGAATAVNKTDARHDEDKKMSNTTITRKLPGIIQKAHLSLTSLASAPKQHSPPWILQSMGAIDSPRPQCKANDASLQAAPTVTLVTQTTMDRVPLLQHTCSRWTDPIIVVVAVPSLSTKPPDWWSTTCAHAQWLPQLLPSDPQDYPVNFYRNVGLQAVSTSHVIVLDVDLIPSRELVSTIHTQLALQAQSQTEAQPTPPTALIVPAWERKLKRPCESTASCIQLFHNVPAYLPDTLATLQQCVSDKKCQVFQEDVNWEGHTATHSYEWLNRSSDPNHPKHNTPLLMDCWDSLRYEPYVVLPWCSLQPPPSSSSTGVSQSAPYYDERFKGYGKNKIEYIQHLRFLGYKFAILPQGYVIHHPHKESPSKEKWNAWKDYGLHKEMDDLYMTFLKELIVKYPPSADRRLIDKCDKK
jgi:Glycosyl-transferase for dystroglycan